MIKKCKPSIPKYYDFYDQPEEVEEEDPYASFDWKFARQKYNKYDDSDECCGCYTFEDKCDKCPEISDDESYDDDQCDAIMARHYDTIYASSVAGAADITLVPDELLPIVDQVFPTHENIVIGQSGVTSANILGQKRRGKIGTWVADLFTPNY